MLLKTRHFHNTTLREVMTRGFPQASYFEKPRQLTILVSVLAKFDIMGTSSSIQPFFPYSVISKQAMNM